MKNRMKSALVAIITLLFVFGNSNLTTLKLQAAEEKQYIPLNQEVTVKGKDFYFEVPCNGKLELEWERGVASVYQGEKEIGYVGSGCGCRVSEGEYRIELFDENTITLKFTSESSSVYEQEENDTFDTANDIVVNSLYYGNCNRKTSGAYEDDYYKFTLFSSGSIYIDTMMENSSIEKFTLYGEDENMNVTEITSFRTHFDYDVYQQTSRKVRVIPGTYYVKVTPTSASTDYQFKVVYNPETPNSYETEANNVQEIANSMLPNVGYTGNIQSEDDVDYYKVILPSKGKVKLRLQTPRQTMDKMFHAELMQVLYNGELQTMDNVYSSENPVTFGNEYILDEGEYYIKVTSGYSAYFEDEYTHIDYNIQCVYDEMTLVESINIFCEQEELMIGDTVTLVAEIFPENVKNKDLEWSSSDIKVAKVDQNGNVTCINLGQAIIIAKATDGSDVYGEYCVVVNKRLVEEIEVSLPEETIMVGEKIQAKAIVLPSNADNTSIIWESSNPKVAKVSSTGMITALKAGKTSIKAIAEDGSGVVGSITLTVEKKKSSDATLKSLSITNGKLNKEFDSKRTKYVLTLNKNTESVKITPEASSKYAVVTINGKKAKNVTVKVAAGKSKKVKIKVVAENGETKIYTIKVVRKN